jgi:hypothetical protein
MTDNSTRETFERTVQSRWSDSYSFERDTDGHYADEVLEGMWWAWQINCPQFTALCHSKSRQIGKPVGLLIENEAGGLAAVHNLGRVTWLDDCVAGPVEKAVSAQDGGEPVAWLWDSPKIGGKQVSAHKGRDPCIGWNEETDEAIYLQAIPLYTRQPSAVVPEGWKWVPIEPDQWMRTQGEEGFDDRSVIEIWGRMVRAAPQQPAQGQWVPTQDKETRWILGRPCFVCAGIAQNLRAKGYEIERKAEDEQAVVIDWMLNLYAKHGTDWRSEAEAFLKTPKEQEQES